MSRVRLRGVSPPAASISRRSVERVLAPRLTSRVEPEDLSCRWAKRGAVPEAEKLFKSADLTMDAVMAETSVPRILLPESKTASGCAMRCRLTAQVAARFPQDRNDGCCATAAFRAAAKAGINLADALRRVLGSGTTYGAITQHIARTDNHGMTSRLKP